MQWREKWAIIQEHFSGLKYPNCIVISAVLLCPSLRISSLAGMNTSTFCIAARKKLFYFLQDFLITLPQVITTGTWLQIGTHTLDPQGSTYQVNDPLLHYLPLYSAYRKVLVEPIPLLFEQLMENAQHLPNIELVNAAVVPDNSVGKTVSMYCPLEEEMVDWLVGICSLDEGFITSHTRSGKSRRFEVPALSVNGLLRTYHVENVRVIMIDAAGYDVKILNMLPFHKLDFKPELIVFEHTEVSIDEYEKAKDLLRSHCYSLAYDRENTYALRLF